MKSDLQLNFMAIQLREQYNYNECSNIDIFDFANKIAYLSIIFYPLGERISGICIKQNKANVIAINSQISLGRQRFSLAHELYHLFYDSNIGTTISSLNVTNENPVEIEANTFASFFLAPYNALAKKVLSYKTIDVKSLLEIEYSFGLSHLALITRLKKDGFINEKQYKEFCNINIIKKAKYYNFADDLFVVTNKNFKRTNGHYIIQANQLKDNNIISNGFYNELLIDAFRTDLVFNKAE